MLVIGYMQHRNNQQNRLACWKCISSQWYTKLTNPQTIEPWCALLGLLMGGGEDICSKHHWHAGECQEKHRRFTIKNFLIWCFIPTSYFQLYIKHVELWP